MTSNNKNLALVPPGVPICLLWKIVNNRWSSQSPKTQGHSQDRPVDLKTCDKIYEIVLTLSKSLPKKRFPKNKGISTTTFHTIVQVQPTGNS